MTKLRMCKFSKRIILTNKNGTISTEKVDVSGYFHCWSIDTDIDNKLQVPIAIVELYDGTVENVYSEMITFLDKPTR